MWQVTSTEFVLSRGGAIFTIFYNIPKGKFQKIYKFSMLIYICQKSRG